MRCLSRLVHGSYLLKYVFWKGGGGLRCVLQCRSWIAECSDTFNTARDLKSLRRCGVLIDMSVKKVRDLNPSDPIVAVQDHLFQEYWRLCFSLVRSKSTAMLRHMYGLPEMLAGLLHDIPEYRARTRAEFESVYDGYQQATEREEEHVQDMVSKSFFPTAPRD